MIEAISNKWWVFLLRGIMALVVAAIAFTKPGVALIGLVLVFGFYAFVIGALATAAAATGVAGGRWWALLLEGLVGIIAALLIWSWPVASAIAFVYFVAAWLIMSGTLQLVAGFALRDLIPNEWLYVLSGVISVAFGIWVFRSPQQGAVATAFLFGWYFLIAGILQIGFALRLRALNTAVIGRAVKA